MGVCEAFQGVTGKYPQPATIIGYLPGAGEVLFDQVGGVGIEIFADAPSLDEVLEGMKDIGIGADLHGDIDHGLAVGIGQLVPDSIKNLLGDAEKVAESV